MTFDPKEARALVKRGNSLNWHLDHTFQVDAVDKGTVKGLTDTLTAALDEIERLRGENATLRTEKHADAEAIGALRGALSAMLDLQDNASPFGGEMYQDRVDRVFDQCREALKGADQ